MKKVICNYSSIVDLKTKYWISGNTTWQVGAAIAGNGKARVETHEVPCSLWIAHWKGSNGAGGAEIFTRVGDYFSGLDVISEAKLVIDFVVNDTVPNNVIWSKLGELG